MGYEERIDESRRHPKPVIRGTGITADQIRGELANGATEALILEAHPRLTREDIQAVREYDEVAQARELERERILEASGRVIQLLEEHERWRRLPSAKQDGLLLSVKLGSNGLRFFCSKRQEKDP